MQFRKIQYYSSVETSGFAKFHNDMSLMGTKPEQYIALFHYFALVEGEASGGTS